jgi:hypothetical protein
MPRANLATPLQPPSVWVSLTGSQPKATMTAKICLDGAPCALRVCRMMRVAAGVRLQSSLVGRNPSAVRSAQLYHGDTDRSADRTVYSGCSCVSQAASGAVWVRRGLRVSGSSCSGGISDIKDLDRFIIHPNNTKSFPVSAESCSLAVDWMDPRRVLRFCADAAS